MASVANVGEALAVDVSAVGSTESPSAEDTGVADEGRLEPEAERNIRGEGAFGIRTDLPTGAGRKTRCMNLGHSHFSISGGRSHTRVSDDR